MIDISLAGLIGAMIGTIVAALAYGVVVSTIERKLLARRLQPAEKPTEDRDAPQNLALLRRGVLALDILIFAGVGYWIGHRIAG